MNISGIYVLTSPDRLEACCADLGALPGVEVHFKDASGKIVVTQEAENVSSEVDGLKRIKALPHIIVAEFVNHWFEEDQELISEIPPDLDDFEGLRQARVPEYLHRP